MKCPNCGAEIGSHSKACEYCGSQISQGMKKEQEQINKRGCPSCGSSNISFSRERRGEIKSKNGSSVVRATVGVCDDCGYTWTIKGSTETYTPKKSKTWLWVLGWICFFPIPLTVLILRSKKLGKPIKYGIVAALWLIIIVWAMASPSTSSTTTNSVSSTKKDASNWIQSLKITTTSPVTVTAGHEDEGYYVDVKTDSYSHKIESTDIILNSDDPNIATATKEETSLSNYIKFKINGISKGTTYIYATNADGTITSNKLQVTVSEPIKVNSITLTYEKTDLVAGETLKIKTEIEPYKAEDKNIIWTSSNESIATVTEDGTVTGLGTGSADITATAASGVSSTVTINVDASKQLLNVSAKSHREDDVNIGSEWSYTYQINGERISKQMGFAVGDQLIIYTRISEDDDTPDVGEATMYHTITEDDLVNGFTEETTIYVTENGGRYAGQSAVFTVTYAFNP